MDVGVRAGMALFSGEGRLLRYRSRNFGTAARLRKGVPGILDESPGLRFLVLEGGGPIADAWAAAASRRGIEVIRVPAERWREALLLPRDRRSGAEAKRHATALARRVAGWSGAPRPRSLTHDAAEAILAGLWGAVEAGLLEELPRELRPPGR